MAKKILIGILILSAALRLINLSSGDTVNDEVFMAFRGIGMADFDEAAVQPTAWELWEQSNPNTPIPSWMRLSMHDHPFLVPLAEHISMAIFGETRWAFRLPSALLGIASTYLVYLLGTALASGTAGLWSAGIFAITLNNVYISRTGMQEPYVIFFLLLASYWFLRSLKNPKWLMAVGAAVGLGMEAKYTAFIAVPIFLTYLLIYKREYFKNKNLWIGAGIALIIFSPSIIYNLKLYQTFGHFDFQISHILDQAPTYWTEAPGKEIGTLTERIKNFGHRLNASNSWVFLTLTAISIIFLRRYTWSYPLENESQRISLVTISFVFLLGLVLLIGPSYRFLTLLAPPFALFIGLAISKIYGNIHTNKLEYVSIKKIFLGGLSIVAAFELFYTANNQLINYPINQNLWLFSKVRYENYNWGYNALEDWFLKETNGKMPALTFDLQYQFLEKFRQKALQKGAAENLELYPALFVYEGNFDAGARLWALDRFHIYHAWPIINLETYYDYLKINGENYFDRLRFKERYFILATNIVPTKKEMALAKNKLTSIKNPRGDEIFKIYKF